MPMFRESRPPEQSLLTLERPLPPPQGPIARDRFELCFKLRGWILQRIARDRGRFLDEDVRREELARIQKEQAHLRGLVQHVDTALGYLQAASDQDFLHYPIFYKALWELMKEKGWDREPVSRKI